MHSSGFHQLVVRDSNAFLPGDYQINPSDPTGAPIVTGTRPNPSLGIVEQYFPEAVFNENQLLAEPRPLRLLHRELGQLRRRRRLAPFQLLQPDAGLRARRLCAAAVALPDGQLHGPLGNHLQSLPHRPGGQPV